MKFFGALSAAGMIAADSSPLPDYEDYDNSIYYSTISSVPKVTDPVSPAACCDSLKMWGDIPLFAGKFNIDGEHDGFPAYKAVAGELKMFFNADLNRWVVSDKVDNSADIRAYGKATSCPDTKHSWKVYDIITEEFETPDLTEPWTPYINSSKMFECWPKSFTAEDLSAALTTKLCDLVKTSDPVHYGRHCRDGEKAIQLVFADWTDATDRFLSPSFLISAGHIETLDQWHALIRSVIVKRTWEMKEENVNAMESFVRYTVNSIRSNFENDLWAAEDSRFYYLKV